MVEMQEMVLTRITLQIDEITDTIEEVIEHQVALHHQDIEFMETYVGTLINNDDNVITSVYLYSGASLLVKMDLLTLLKNINEKRELLKAEGFFKRSN